MPEALVVDLPEGLVTVGELAKYYKVSTRVIHYAAARGQIPGHFKVLGKHLFDLEEAKTWVPHEANLRAKFGETDPVTGAVVKGNRLHSAETAIRFAQHPVAKIPKRDSKLYHQFLAARLTPEAWIEIVDKAIQEAKDGGLDGHRARKWLGDYVLGRPIERIQAELNLNVKKEYSQAQRAVAITDLLLGVKTGGGDIIDVTPRKVSEDTDAGPVSEGGASGTGP